MKYTDDKNIEQVVLFIQEEFNLKEKALRALSDKDNKAFLAVVEEVIFAIARTAKINTKEADEALKGYISKQLKEKKYGTVER